MEVEMVTGMSRIFLFQIILLIEARIIVGYIVLFKKKALKHDEQEKRMELLSAQRLKAFIFDIVSFVIMIILRLFDNIPFDLFYIVLQIATLGLLLYITQEWIGKQIKTDDCIYNYSINLRQGSFDIFKAFFISAVVALLFSDFKELFVMSFPVGIVILGLSLVLFSYISWKWIIHTKLFDKNAE
jgi:hypothetical protein